MHVGSERNKFKGDAKAGGLTDCRRKLPHQRWEGHTQSSWPFGMTLPIRANLEAPLSHSLPPPPTSPSFFLLCEPLCSVTFYPQMLNTAQRRHFPQSPSLPAPPLLTWSFSPVASVLSFTQKTPKSQSPATASLLNEALHFHLPAACHMHI